MAAIASALQLDPDFAFSDAMAQCALQAALRDADGPVVLLHPS